MSGPVQILTEFWVNKSSKNENFVCFYLSWKIWPGSRNTVTLYGSATGEEIKFYSLLADFSSEKYIVSIVYKT